MPAGSGRYPSGQRGQTVNLLAYAFGGSNPPLPTIITGGNSSAVERQPSKLGVAGSNPVSRSKALRAERRTWRLCDTRREASGEMIEIGRMPFGAHVAQSAERVLGKDEVSGSIPDMGSTSRFVGAIVDGR